MSETGPAEFDRYSPGYDAGMADPVKRALGADARAFLEPKLDLILTELRRRGRDPAAPLQHLDFGCGAGDFLQLVGGRMPAGRSEGCDVSAGMLAEAARRWPGLPARSPLWLIDPARFPSGRYDLVTAICVFHHIPPAEWLDCFRRVRAALRPGGLFCLIEHNPWNPVTRWVVSRAAIDEHAVLLSPQRSRRLMAAAGFGGLATRHFLFLPPRWRRLAAVERAVRWLPAGGQYCLAALAPS